MIVLFINMNQLKIEIKHFTKKYRRKFIYNDFNYEIDNRHINILKSPNGYGKSTLIKAILGIIKYQGRIKTNVRSFSFLPEHINLPNYVRVDKFLDDMNIPIDKSKELLKLFNVDASKTINELSKGMRQKVLLVDTLLSDAQCYIFDEPLNGLDDESCDIFVKLIQDLFSLGRLIIIATHQVERFKINNLNIIKLGEINVL